MGSSTTGRTFIEFPKAYLQESNKMSLDKLRASPGFKGHSWMTLFNGWVRRIESPTN